MDPSFVVYIDESGDEGFEFAKGSPEWFVLSAVITSNAHDLATVKLIDEVRELLEKPPKYYLHFCKLKHHQRLPYIEKIAEASLRTISIIIHKPSILEPEKFREGHMLYFYATRLLLERVSWLCRDRKSDRVSGDGSALINFSNRSSMSYTELRRYLRHLHEISGVQDIRIEWSVINEDQIRTDTPQKRMGLQIADAVATSLFYAFRPKLNFVETRYAEMLKPVVYRHRGKYLGYGIKFFPWDIEGKVRAEPEYDWLRKIYI